MPLARRFLFVFGLGALMLALNGCSRTDGAGGSEQRPKVLRIAMTVSEETVEARARKDAYRDLTAYLSEKLKLRVELVEMEGYAPTIEAMRAGKLDVCTSSPMPYLVAKSRMDVVPLVVPAMPDGSASTYYSTIITHPGTGLKTLDDVKARAAELTLAFADPASTSGHLIPRAKLETMGLNAERDFKRVVFASNHTASVLTVKSGKVDVAAITQTLLDRMIHDGRIAAKDIVILWTSPAIHQSVNYARASLPADVRQALIDAYLNLAKERPDIWTGLRSRSTTGATGYAPADDSMFEDFRTIARRLEHVKLLN